jgi:hypothetical protein
MFFSADIILQTLNIATFKLSNALKGNLSVVI